MGGSSLVNVKIVVDLSLRVRLRNKLPLMPLIRHVLNVKQRGQYKLVTVLCMEMPHMGLAYLPELIRVGRF
jgi:hypothetical protein